MYLKILQETLLLIKYNYTVFYRNLTSPEFQTNVFPKMIGVPDNAWI